jgi:hypothetical protein
LRRARRRRDYFSGGTIAARAGVEPLFRSARLRVWPTFARFQRLTVSVCLVFEAMAALLTFRIKSRANVHEGAPKRKCRCGAARAAGAVLLARRAP